MTSRDRLEGLVGQLLPMQLERMTSYQRGGELEDMAIRQTIELAERVMAAVDQRVGTDT
jgi:hypothetical protein